jgi:Protein of unknown function (DUF2735)
MEISMNMNLNRGSATIYQFPVGGRAALGARPDEQARAASESVAERSAAPRSDSWYHEAAIQESRQARER